MLGTLYTNHYKRISRHRLLTRTCQNLIFGNWPLFFFAPLLCFLKILFMLFVRADVVGNGLLCTDNENGLLYVDDRLFTRAIIGAVHD